ncbi:MAG: hypothetical protein CM15mP114_09660 [Alphaproteobacteria bacterium]|nr:MAG: hypothetical protein CM15mP114_09660 [Alphaproteobacteria bacterium]
MHKLDHIVFGSSTLEEGTEFVENILQAKLSDIGYHKDMGTHNRVIRISERVYLEVIAIDPKISNLKNRKWFNLDNSNLQSKLKKSPQIIGYVIENNDMNISKYYDPFFEASRDNYKWQFAMPTFKNNILDREIIEAGIIPSLISWKSEKPIYQMKKNQFELISFEIKLSESQQHFNTFFKIFWRN